MSQSVTRPLQCAKRSHRTFVNTEMCSYAYGTFSTSVNTFSFLTRTVQSSSSYLKFWVTGLSIPSSASRFVIGLQRFRNVPLPM